MFNYNESTKTLIIQPEFNNELVNLPKDVKIMIFENKIYPNYSKFNQNVDKLPPNLTHLTFGWDFNQNVDKLPSNLTHLTFGKEFNQNINKLPSSINYLGLTSDSLVKNNIPIIITKINIIFSHYDEHNENITNLPPTIQEIKINNKDKIHYLKKIPYGCVVKDEDDNIIIIS